MIQRSILFDLVFEPLVALFLTSVLLFLNSVAYLIRLAFHNRKADIAPKSLVVVVTGCDTGFGELTAVQLQEAGFNVVAACLTVTGTARIKNLVTLSIVCDITKEDDVALLAYRRIMPITKPEAMGCSQQCGTSFAPRSSREC